MIGTIGNVAVVRPEYPEFSIKNVGLFKAGGDRLLAEYIAYWLQSNGAIKFATNRASGTTQRYIPLGFLRNYPLPIPRTPIQRQIADILSAVDRKIEAEENKSKALGELFRTMLHNLMTGKIRVRNMEI